MTARRALLAVALVALSAGAARAQDLRDRFNIRLSLTGMYLTESQDLPTAMGMMGVNPKKESAPYSLGYGELRAVVDGRRLPGKFDVHLDVRLRISGEYDTNELLIGAGGVKARGYYGGKEYELRQAWVRRRGEKWDFGLGRLVVGEADQLKLDGGRIWWRFVKHWDASLFAGGYPDPYSRSLLTDYVVGAPAIVGGADVSYFYDRYWGSAAIVGSYLGGNDDGGALNPATPQGRPATELTRTFLTWTGFERFASWLDVYHDLVLDLAGAAGVQLTRLDVYATARAGRFFTLRLGYDHLSALAIEMYLVRLLASQFNRALFMAGTLENNLLLQRTARDEGRLQLDFTYQKLSVYGEGRFRRRALVDPGQDPQFTNAGEQLAPGLAFDATIGLRERGSLGGVRFGLWYTYLSDYRSHSHLANFDLGRSFFEDRFGFEVAFLYANTHDNLPRTVGCDPTAMLVTRLSNCFGQRVGDSYELGLSLWGSPHTKLFGFLDYRMVINTNDPIAAIFTHVLVLRLEARL